jgi:hypothetical protein
VDLTVAKAITLHGHTRLQVRFESFNVFNWRQYNNPVLNVVAPNFGHITSVASTRTGANRAPNHFLSSAIALHLQARKIPLWYANRTKLRAY